MSNDPDLDILRNEAEAASTPTRRSWAQRILKRIENLESGRGLLTQSSTWQTTTNRHDDTSNRDTGRVEEGPDDRRGPDGLPAS